MVIDLNDNSRLGLPISDKAQQLIDDIRRRILDDLHVYYQNKMGLNDYSMRLGNLMSLNHAVQVIDYL